MPHTLSAVLKWIVVGFAIIGAGSVFAVLDRWVRRLSSSQRALLTDVALSPMFFLQGWAPAMLVLVALEIARADTVPPLVFVLVPIVVGMAAWVRFVRRTIEAHRDWRAVERRDSRRTPTRE